MLGFREVASVWKAISQSPLGEQDFVRAELIVMDALSMQVRDGTHDATIAPRDSRHGRGIFLLQRRVIPTGLGFHSRVKNRTKESMKTVRDAPEP